MYLRQQPFAPPDWSKITEDGASETTISTLLEVHSWPSIWCGVCIWPSKVVHSLAEAAQILSGPSGERGTRRDYHDPVAHHQCASPCSRKAPPPFERSISDLSPYRRRVCRGRACGLAFAFLAPPRPVQRALNHLGGVGTSAPGVDPTAIGKSEQVVVLSGRA